MWYLVADIRSAADRAAGTNSFFSTENMLVALSILAGLVLLVVGGELLVRGAASLAAAFRISPLVIGLTVVAFGTSAPELGVSLQASFSGNGDVAVGNVLGSNIINVLLILGLAALVAPLVVSSQLIRKDVPLMIGASLVVWWMSLDGAIARWEGITLFVALLIYIGYSIASSRKESLAVQDELEEYGTSITGKKAMAVQVSLLIGGLVLLGIGSNLLVDGATTVATKIGVSKLVIGLTVVAIGTSLPEMVTSVVASYRGQRDIAVGNVVGSNLFNLLCVLGLTAAISPTPIPVSPAAIGFDIPVMVAVALICFPVFATGNLVRRWEGAMFVLYYVAYTALIVLSAKGSPLTTNLQSVIAYGVVPLTLLTFAATLFVGRRTTKTIQ
ncbi:Inner membrane protein YrbG [Rubripirellula lacrimiformis]|uniref:Inner membrane protein YrbG n=1 Tax=Rubripirellula lacrimiformis TaxID=1930273 RepID=A0A517NGF3_9BACT|nr:calcium/sodium antiporter [Rubripirellula lacrimiformis]QDT06209.1 Inner membrane protein YrbG [Rubripirellula lacrimiformis]